MPTAAYTAGNCSARASTAVQFSRSIAVVLLHPGYVATEMVGEEYESLIPRIPLNRMGTAEEVAGVVYRLCQRDFGYVTGTEIFVTGGQHLF